MTAEEYDKLTNEEKRIKVAELCGWTDFEMYEVNGRTVWYGFHDTHHPQTKYRYVTPLPDYLNDLNAMHKAENANITNTLSPKYNKTLFDVCIRVGWHPERATAAQRAKAFVLTMTE